MEGFGWVRLCVKVEFYGRWCVVMCEEEMMVVDGFCVVNDVMYLEMRCLCDGWFDWGGKEGV